MSSHLEHVRRLPPKAAKTCALTFDDGPDADLTPLVLDKLDSHDVRATFFMVGSLIGDGTKPVIERIIDSGHEIGNHSWNYLPMDKMPASLIKRYIEKTNEVIAAYSGAIPRFFRPPNLALSQTMFDSIDLPFACGIAGDDWLRTTSAEYRANKILDSMRDGAIIVLHDVQPLPHPTPESLDILIPELKRRGYAFLTLTELFAEKGVEPANGTVYEHVEVLTAPA